MGDVAVRYRVLPESPTEDIDALVRRIEASLPEEVALQSLSKKPFAFGLTALELLLVMRDAGGITERVEGSLSEVEGVQSVETLEMSLV